MQPGYIDGTQIGKFRMLGKPDSPRIPAALLLAIALIGCRRSPREPVTLQYT